MPGIDQSQPRIGSGYDHIVLDIAGDVSVGTGCDHFF